MKDMAHIRRLPAMALASAALFAVTLTGCGDSGGEAAGSDKLVAVVDTVDGVERLSYPAARGPQLQWKLDTLVVLGGVNVDDPDFQFTAVGSESVTGDADGNLYVVDAMANKVLHYDATGAFVAEYGREGGGPGELMQPSGIAVGPDGTLWIPDFGNQRVNLLRTDGSEPGSIGLGEDSGGVAGRLVARDDGFFGVLRIFSFTPDENAGFPPQPLVRISTDGEVLDTVWLAPAPGRDMVTIESNGSMFMMMMSRTFSPMFAWDAFSAMPGGDLFAVTDNAEYDVRLVDDTGMERLRIQRAPAARAATEEDRETVKERTRQEGLRLRGGGPNDEHLLEKRLEAMTFEDVIPRLTNLAIDGKDRVWVGVREDGSYEHERIDVYDRRGSLIGEIRGLEDFPDAFFGDNLVAIIGEDKFDVPTITIATLVDDSTT